MFLSCPANDFVIQDACNYLDKWAGGSCTTYFLYISAEEDGYNTYHTTQTEELFQQTRIQHKDKGYFTGSEVN